MARGMVLGFPMHILAGMRAVELVVATAPVELVATCLPPAT